MVCLSGNFGFVSGSGAGFESMSLEDLGNYFVSAATEVWLVNSLFMFLLLAH